MFKLKIRCPWCEKDLGFKLVKEDMGDMVSDGICEDCYDNMIAELEEN